MATEGRNAASLQGFFDGLTDGQKASIRAVSIDMSAGYEKAIRDPDHGVPHAQVCFDPFHVVQLGSKAADQVRRAEYNQHGRSSSSAGKWIKGTRLCSGGGRAPPAASPTFHVVVPREQRSMHKLMDPRDTNDYEAQASGRGRSPLSAGNGHMLAVDNFPPSRAAFGSGGSASHDPLGCTHRRGKRQPPACRARLVLLVQGSSPAGRRSHELRTSPALLLFSGRRSLTSLADSR